MVDTRTQDNTTAENRRLDCGGGVDFMMTSMGHQSESIFVDAPFVYRKFCVVPATIFRSGEKIIIAPDLPTLVTAKVYDICYPPNMTACDDESRFEFALHFDSYDAFWTVNLAALPSPSRA